MNIYARSISHKMVTCALVLILTGIINCINGQNKITVEIEIDTSEWAPVAYLSIIPAFNHLNTISYKHIIQESPINESGIYEFNTEYIPESEHLYRIHFSKKDDPQASLIIGGRDQNHFYLFAKRKSEIYVKASKGKNLINNLTFKGYAPNDMLQHLNVLLAKLDSIERAAKKENRDYTIETIYSDIRKFADTCSFPLVSLYALYHTDYHEYYENNPDYYRHLLRSWRSEESAYFVEFRDTLGLERQPSVRVIVLTASFALLILIILAFVLIRKDTNSKSRLAGLTIQERKVFELLRQGKSNKEIADECSVSTSTVKSHVNSIFAKLNIKSRKEIFDI